MEDDFYGPLAENMPDKGTFRLSVVIGYERLYWTHDQKWGPREEAKTFTDRKLAVFAVKVAAYRGSLLRRKIEIEKE